MPTEQQQPRPGDTVEVTYRGTLTALDSCDGIEIARAGVVEVLPVGPYAIRIIDPIEPTVIGTVVTGWLTPNDGRPEAMYLYALTSVDRDGDGLACWQTPGSKYEYRWPSVVADTEYGRRIIAPPTSSGEG
jgi:hypothetical protein